MTAEPPTIRSSRVTDLEVAYGEARALFGVSLRRAARVPSPRCSARTVPGSRRSRRRSPASSSRARAGSSSTGEDITGWTAHRVCKLGLAYVPESRNIFPHLTVRDNLWAQIRFTVPRSDAPGRARPCVRDVPDPRRAPPSAGGHALGRRAADAHARPCARGAAEAAHRRRDVARPRAADGRPRVRVARAGRATKASPCCSSSSSWSVRSGFADEAVILRHGLVGWRGQRERGRQRAPRRVPRRRDRVHALREFAFRPPRMRTYVRVRDAGGLGRGDDPARRPRRLLRVGRAARRPSPARPAGHRRGRGGAVVELRGACVRRAHRDGRTTGPAAVPAGDRGHAPDVGLLRGERGGVRGVRRHHAAGRGPVDRRSVPRRRRAPADIGHTHRDRRAVAAATCSSASVCPSRWAWPGPSSSPRSRAAWRSPTVCSWCRPSGELDFLHPLRVERLWGVGPATARQAPRARHHHGRRRRPTHRGVARLDARHRIRTPPATRSPTTAILGRWSSVAADVRSARNTRSVVAAVRPTTSTRSSSAWSTVCRPHARPSGRVGLMALSMAPIDPWSYGVINS